jgi:hypothetical protein
VIKIYIIIIIITATEIGSIQGQVMWYLWWTKWHLIRFSPSASFPLCQFSFHQLLHIHYSSHHRRYKLAVLILPASSNNQLKKKIEKKISSAVTKSITLLLTSIRNSKPLIDFTAWDLMALALNAASQPSTDMWAKQTYGGAVLCFNVLRSRAY